jgi:hypothetical protein
MWAVVNSKREKHHEKSTLYIIIPYYIEFNGQVMASMKIKTVQTILLSAV